MKIRCGSHQQNRSIVRPGLSLMAAKVALTAEEFRENSQRSIALFNTEKLSTNSTHVLKSAYCNSVHFCRCNLHGACGGKGDKGNGYHNVGRCNLHGACGGKAPQNSRKCGRARTLQSARSVWRQSSPVCTASLFSRRCNLHGACGGKVSGVAYSDLAVLVAICTERVEAKIPPFLRQQVFVVLQSARGVWRQSEKVAGARREITRCNLHGACRETERHHPPKKSEKIYADLLHFYSF